jgi:hypothetical protein
MSKMSSFKRLTAGTCTFFTFVIKTRKVFFHFQTDDFSNLLAYYTPELITGVKSFIERAPGNGSLGNKTV